MVVVGQRSNPLVGPVNLKNNAVLRGWFVNDAPRRTIFVAALENRIPPIFAPNAHGPTLGIALRFVAGNFERCASAEKDDGPRTVFHGEAQGVDLLLIRPVDRHIKRRSFGGVVELFLIWHGCGRLVVVWAAGDWTRPRRGVG